MTPPLFLLDELPLAERPEHEVLLLTGDEGRHAARVRRIGVGEPVLVGDGRGTVLDCLVAAVRDDGLELRALRRRAVPPPEPRLVVVQALPKGDRAELAVEVMTELGGDEIVPWAASRSITQWHGPRGDKALQRWRRTAREAAKQSRRPWVPAVAELASTARIAALMAGTTAFVLHESATEPLADQPLPGSGDVLVVVGPEGGITDDELDRFAAAGAAAVRLGEPVLRTSTAGAAALAVLSARLGRWA
jgi:16S rRNA (uracil1498-N3)-methyltransferase